MRSLRTLLALALLLSAASPASGQLLLFPVGQEDTTVVGPGGQVELEWVVGVPDGTEGRFVRVEVEVAAPGGAGAASGWVATVDPDFVHIDEGGTQAFTVTVEPKGDPQPRRVEVGLLVHSLTANGAERTDTAAAAVEARGFAQVLGRFDNPLPAPLDGVAGTFLLNVVAWLLIALVAMWLVDPTLRLLTLRTRTTVDDKVIRILSRPLFTALFAFGVKQSIEVFPLPARGFRLLHALWVVLLIVLVVYIAFRLWHEIVLATGRRFASRTESRLDDRLYPVLEKVGGVVIVLVGFFYVLDSLGVNMTWFAAGGAMVSLVIAFAAQDTLANFFSGVHILVDQPFKEGDDIILDSGEICTVKRIGLRSTDLYHSVNHEVIVVPNSLLATNRVINLLQPDNLYKVKVEVGVAYGTDVQKVKRILLELARSHPLGLDEEGHQPFVRFNAFGASSLDFAVHVWISDVYARWAVASDLREMIDQRFAEEGIEIPFPQTTVWFGREEAKAGSAPAGPREAPRLHRTNEAARLHQGEDASDEG